MIPMDHKMKHVLNKKQKSTAPATPGDSDKTKEVTM